MMRELSPAEALEALELQIALGADEAIGESPVDRFMDPEPSAGRPRPAPLAVPDPPPPVPVPEPGSGAAASAAALASGATSLEALRAALEAFDGCPLRRGARSTVFADGNPAARLMIIGEAPGREEDIAGKPFVGRSGQLLDRMLAAIGLSRQAEDPERAVYITNVLPWRPPQNRDPSADEAAMLLPFLTRHIELKAPAVLVTMGNAATHAVLEVTTGITRVRGRWADWRGIPVLPMFHPAALLRNPSQKREAWADLLTLRARLFP